MQHMSLVAPDFPSSRASGGGGKQDASKTPPGTPHMARWGISARCGEGLSGPYIYHRSVYLRALAVADVSC